MKTLFLKVMKNEVTLDLSVLGTLMKDIIMGNVNGSAIIIVNGSYGGLRSTHFDKKSMKLE